MAETEKKIITSYRIERYSDGSLEVKDNEIEGTTKLTAEQMFQDIEDTAKMISYRRIENSTYTGVLRALKAAAQIGNADEILPTKSTEAKSNTTTKKKKSSK